MAAVREPVRELPEEGIDDMITFDNLTEEIMLANLQRRYERNRIYTYTGTILVSVNPFKSLPIYTNAILTKYIGKRIGLEPPHIFAVADESYRNMREHNQNQSIIISGESGSGKTEATKLILQYLATMTNKHSEVEQAILQSSPVLEAFGNAKTVRNNNSSRFGKLIEVNFDAGGAISGARITQYLLEKSRIVTQAATERNYHIFYQLLAGATAEEKAKWKLTRPEDYRYLNQSGCVQLPGVSDDDTFQKTRTAMAFLGVGRELQESIFVLLAAVLHVGNIEFVDANEKAKLKNEEAVRLVASLLQVDERKLQFALTNRTLKISGTETVVPLKLDQAVDTRDALAKALYSRLFEWLVGHINKVIQKPDARLFIGVLDIFGFENFRVNSFEQLCINFTNEKLQLHFNEHIFRLEQEEYAREKIVWTKVDFKDNQECIDLIERSQAPLGVLALLDEECRFPKASDTTFLEKIASTHAKHKYFDKPKTSKSSFVVKHYAGNVAYEVKDFLEKNRDTLQVDLLSCLMASGSDLVKTLMRSAAEAAATPEDKSQAGKRAPTVGGNFKNQLLALMRTLSETNAHYVRCIKPNALQAADNFDSDLVLAQLRYAGMLETVRIRRCGYPIRFQFAEFFKRYVVLAGGVAQLRPGKDPRANCERLLERLKLAQEHVQAGASKMFLRDYHYAAMEDRRNALLAQRAVRVQTWWRARVARRAFLAKRAAAVALQKYTRRYLALNRFLLTYIATVTLQKALRGQLVRIRYTARIADWRDKKKREAEERRRQEEQRKKEEAERKRREEEQRKKDEEERRVREAQLKKEEEERKAREAELRRAEEERKRREEEERKREEEERRRREAEQRKREEEERRRREEEEQARLTAEQLRRAEEQRRREEEERRREEEERARQAEERRRRDEEERARLAEERRQLEEARRRAEEERRALEEARRQVEEEKRQAAEELKRKVEEEKARLEAERRKAEEDRKKKEEEDLARAGGAGAARLGKGPPRGLQIGRDRGASGAGSAGAGGRAAVEEANPLVTHVASMALQKQLLEAQRVNEKKWKPFQLATGLAEPPPVLAEELANEFNFYAWAQRRFRPPEEPKGSWFSFGAKRRAPTVAELASFQRAPLESSLLDLSPQAAAAAVESFAVLLRWTTTPPGEPAVPVAALQETLRRGVLKPELRDELYAQAIKCANASPAEHLGRAWELLAAVCASFVPSADLLKHAAGFLLSNRKSANRDVAAWAAFCLRRLERAAMQAGRGKRLYRIHAPSAHELACLRARGPVTVAVRTPDGEVQELAVDSAATANECLGLLMEKLGLQDASFWALYEIFTPRTDAPAPPAPAAATGAAVAGAGQRAERLERSLFVDEYVCDALAKAEFAARTYSFQLVFRKKIFLFPQLLPDDPREYELLYHQVAEDVLEGRLPVSEKEALRLAAYRMKYEEHFVKLESLIPRALWRRHSEAEWKKLLLREEVQAASRDEAMHYFLVNATQLPLFGAALFAVENTADKSLPRDFELMLNAEGVHLVRQEPGRPDEPRRLLGSYFYADVKVDYTAASVTLLVVDEPKPAPAATPAAAAGTTTAARRVRSLELQTKRGSEVHSVYHDYFYWLQAQSEWARATQDYRVDDPALLPFRTGDLIKVTDKKDPEWYSGEHDGRTGMFPSAHVILLLRPPPEAGPEGRGARRRAPTAKAPEGEGAGALGLRASSGTLGAADAEAGTRRRTGTVARDRAPAEPAAGAAESTGRDRSGSQRAGLTGSRLRSSSRVEPPAPAAPRFVKHDAEKWATYQAELGHESRLEAFAQAHFKAAALVGGAQRGRVNIGRRTDSSVDLSHFTPLVSHTREPLKDSLLAIDSAHVRLAVEQFRAVMRLMDDLPKTGRPDWEDVQGLMALGLEHQSANPETSHMTLAEEIFIQIVKQINNNPEIEGQRRGLELLCIACGTLVPNNSVFRALLAFLTETSRVATDEVVLDLVKDCLDRLVYLREADGERRLPPSTQEIQAVQVGGQLQQIVYFSDGRPKTLDVECFTTVKDFVDQLGEPRRFRGYAMFEVLVATGLYMENTLKPDELVVDVLSRWERFVPPVRVEGELVFQLIWKKHIFLKSDRDEANPAALNLLYHQMVSSVVTGQLSASEEEAIQLAGVQLRHDFEQADEAREILENHLDSYLPSQYHHLGAPRRPLSQRGQPGVGRGSPAIPRIMQVYQATAAAPKAELQKAYLARAKALPLYGRSTFNVQYAVDRRLRPCLLALSEDHLQLWEVGPNQKAPVRTLEYADIANWGPRQGALNITSGDLFSPTVDIVETAESFEIAEVIKAYKTAKAEAMLYAQRGDLPY